MAQANLLLYTDNLVNSFQDNSSGATIVYTNSSPVYGSAGYSIKATFTSTSGALYLRYGPGFDTRPYSNFSFWINGGSTGGQKLQVLGLVTDIPQTPFVLTPLKANAWQQFTVPLASLGVSGKTNCTGFQILNGGTGIPATFYVDAVQVNSRPAPLPVQINVRATNTIRTADARWFGVNTATWDNDLGNSATLPALKAAGILALRFPGGSSADDYNWATDPTGNTSFLLNMAGLGSNAQAIITVNYGSGTSNEAAGWVLYANATNHAHFKYWEIGNECYGSWETDNNTVAHDPYTYALRAANYMLLMRAADPTIKIGVVAVPGDDSYANYTSHPVLDKRTGQTHNGWTPVMLATLQSIGAKPDFLIYHSYPEYTPTPVSVSPPSPCPDSDPFLLQSSYNWAEDGGTLRQEISDYIGATGTNIELVCTENNSDSTGGGKQLSSLVDALYMADSLGQLMKTEFNSHLWWDLRNGAGMGGSFDPTLYGWRTTGDFGLIDGPSAFYPTYYSLKLMQYFVRPGDTILAAASDYPLLSAYAARKADGGLALLIINKDPATNFIGQINLDGFVPRSNSVVYSYGIPQDNAVKNNLAAALQDIAVANFAGAGAQFTHSFPPYSLTLLTFQPAAPHLQALPSSAGQFVFQLQGQPGTSYVIQSSANLVNWTSIATNFLTGSEMTVTIPANSGARTGFWRAIWVP